MNMHNCKIKCWEIQKRLVLHGNVHAAKINSKIMNDLPRVFWKAEIRRFKGD